MKKNKKLAALLLAAVTMTGMAGGCSKSEQTSADNEEVTLTFLNCWQGSTLPSGVDYEHNPVADVIAEKTGVRIKYLACTTSEMERLNLAFSTGDIPDIISAPFWGGHDGHTVAIKKAAKEGLLMPLNDLISEYGENLSDAFTFRLRRDYLENDIEDPEFNGEHYIIPWAIPASDEDVRGDAINAYARKDILETLGVDPKSINHSEKLYELMKQIRDYGFKDANGQDIIVSGTLHSGYTYEPFYNSYISQRDMFSSFKHENGEIKLYENTERYAQQILFMRKLIAEGLFDKECMEQTNALASEKLATGKVAIVGADYGQIKNIVENTLYKTNPEMEYVPLGPIINMDGEPYNNAGVKSRGVGGGTVYIISAQTKYPEKVMEFLNFMNSEEGMLLQRYGIEGVHYTMVDGKPRLTDEWLQKYNEDPNALKKEGIDLYPFTRKNANLSKYGEVVYGVDPNGDEGYNKAVEAAPYTFVDDVYSLNYIATRYDKWDEIQTLMQTGDGGLMAKARFAATEEEAWEYINQSRAVYERGGIKEFEAWMTEHQNDGIKNE